MARQQTMISFTSLARASEIGSNSYLLDLDGVRVVLDCGMHPKKEGNDCKPDYGLIGAADPDVIFVTHAHLDHIGTLPCLQDEYPAAGGCDDPGHRGDRRGHAAQLRERDDLPAPGEGHCGIPVLHAPGGGPRRAQLDAPPVRRDLSRGTPQRDARHAVRCRSYPGLLRRADGGCHRPNRLLHR